jgi:2-polyprenyl-6-hydroxyphenyl methylase/3-demethylubiquinone-9 3-methyltransferase
MMTAQAQYQDYGYSDGSLSSAHAYVLPAVRRALRGLKPNARVLDLGCGNGALTAALARDGHTFCGVDLADSGVSISTRLHPEIRFTVADIQADLIPLFGPHAFDAAICCEVIEHVYAPRLVLKNARHLLKPAGLFVVTTPYHGYLKDVCLAVLGQADRHRTALWDGGHIKFWSRRTLSTLLAEAGFLNLTFSGAGRLPLLWKSMVMTARTPGA